MLDPRPTPRERLCDALVAVANSQPGGTYEGTARELWALVKLADTKARREQADRNPAERIRQQKDGFITWMGKDILRATRAFEEALFDPVLKIELGERGYDIALEGEPEAVRVRLSPRMPSDAPAGPTK